MTQEGRLVSDRYALLRRIGEGRHGIVFEASDRQSGDRVAVKVLREPGLSSQGLQAHYGSSSMMELREDPNICSVSEVVEADGLAALVMPLLPGRSLADELGRSGGPLEPARAMDIAYQVMGALQRCHDLGVVHEDLKPYNVQLTGRAGQHEVAVVTDLGLERALEAAGVHRAEGLPPQVPDPEYLAPEQARGSLNRDARIDVHALGVLLFELFTGSQPFRAESPERSLARVLQEVRPSLRAIQPSVPQPVEQVVLHAMALEPSSRHSSVRQLKHALIKQARRSGMALPGYLARLGFTGGIPVFDPTDLDLDVPDLPSVSQVRRVPRRRSRLPAALRGWRAELPRWGIPLVAGAMAAGAGLMLALRSCVG